MNDEQNVFNKIFVHFETLSNFYSSWDSKCLEIHDK